MANGYVKQNAFNVYVPHRLGVNNNVSGMGAYKHTQIAVNDLAVIYGTAMIHELGHNFNLYHTFGNNNVRPDPYNCEHVTRDINDPNYNAASTYSVGDEVADTNAVPNFLFEQHNHIAYADGIYNVILVCDGQVQNSINLSKE